MKNILLFYFFIFAIANRHSLVERAKGITFLEFRDFPKSKFLRDLISRDFPKSTFFRDLISRVFGDFSSRNEILAKFNPFKVHLLCGFIFI